MQLSAPTFVPGLLLINCSPDIEKSIVVQVNAGRTLIAFEIDGIVVDIAHRHIGDGDVLGVEESETILHGRAVHPGADDDDVAEVVGRAADRHVARPDGSSPT